MQDNRQQGQSKIGGPLIKNFSSQILKLTGGNVSDPSAAKFAFTALLVSILDFILFTLLTHRGDSLCAAHSISFIVAAISLFLLTTCWSFPDNDKTLSTRSFFSFMIVALLAYFLRGGILGTLTETLNLPAQLAILAAIGAATIVNYTGCALWVFPQKAAVAAEHTWRLLTIGIVSYTILLRLAYIGIGELLPEEAYYWNYAQHMDIGYLDHPPMVAWIIWLNTSIFGDIEFGVRFGAFLCWMITGGFLFGLTRNLFDKAAAFRALLLFAALPFFFGAGFFMFPDSPLVACWAGALFFLERALIANKRLAWYGVGVCLGLGMLSKYTIALLGPAILIFLLLEGNSRKWFFKPEPYLAAIIAMVLFSPVIFWNATHDWASFNFQGPHRWHDASVFSLHFLLGHILALLTPTGLLAAIFLLFPTRKRPIKNILILVMKSRKALFGLIFSIPPLAVFVFFSLSREVKASWTGPLWLVLLPFIALQMKRQFGSRFQLPLNKAWPATILTCLLLYGAVLHYLTLGFPGVPYPDYFHLVGWQDFSRQIDFVEDALAETKTEKAIVVGVDKYNLASLLAFYRTKGGTSIEKENQQKIQLTSGSHLFGMNSLMYEYWTNKTEMEDKLMILVSMEENSLKNPAIISHFQFVNPIQDIQIQKNGHVFGRYFYRIAEKYTSADPPITEFAASRHKGSRQKKRLAVSP
ncbi:MAG: glycosyltransferase family 39 protein [Proteobacteria bacterium]|nr:glycosyltransferase family 39 protein [Pseudomonadota bacterium]